MEENIVNVEGVISTGTISAEENYKAHKAKLKAVLEELKESARTYFKETAKALFEAYPVLESFAWTQYTPYFCDGDPCEFGVNSDLCELNGDDDPSYSKWDNATRKSQPKDDPLSKAGFAASRLIASVDDQSMQSMFGDHVKVTVTKEGITTEAYDHD